MKISMQINRTLALDAFSVTLHSTMTKTVQKEEGRNLQHDVHNQMEDVKSSSVVHFFCQNWEGIHTS